MKRHVTVLIFLFAGVSIFAQANWRFDTKIERNNHYLLEGTIADKYPITMYLEYDNFCLYENKWNYARTLKGWYSYNNRKVKLPLIGSEKYYEADEGSKEKRTLYVPSNIQDNIHENSCDLEKFNEIFITEETQDWNHAFETMQWKTSNNKSFLSVKLKQIRRPSSETKAFILLYIRGIEIFSLDLTNNLRDLKDSYGDYVDQINIEASKEIDNDFYLIFSFSIPSAPGGIGMGYCGAGYEDYLGFLHIKSFELKEFKYFQTASCMGSFEGKYRYDKNAPEKGVTENKQKNE